MINSNNSCLHAFHLPDYRSINPYQQLLCDELATEDVDVSFPAGYRLGLPIIRSLPIPCPDVLHLHWITRYMHGDTKKEHVFYALRLILDLSLVRLRGIRIIWTVHNVSAHDASFPAVDTWVRRGIARLVDQIIVHDPVTREKVSETYGISSGKVTVIPHGHYRALYTQDSSNLPDVDVPDPEGRLFLYLGTLRPYKGLTALLEAWKTHTKNHPEDHLLVAGKALDDDFGARLSQAAAAIDAVDLHMGYVDEEKVPSYYACADVAVFPFRKITTSGSLILAMSFGIPVVAPDFESLTWTAGDASKLFYDHRGPVVPALTDALRRASTCDLQALRDSTERVCDKMGWDTIAKMTKKVYEEVLAS